MRFPWLSVRPPEEPSAGLAGITSYQSERLVESVSCPGVKLRIAKISFNRRLEIMRRVRELAREVEFAAGLEHVSARMDAALLHAEIERTYVGWGVVEVQGLTIDGKAAGPEMLAAGPEDLFREALAAVQKELGLSGEERKN